MNSRSVIVLLGPTCVGKTGASILLAQSLGTEIISADSMQVYRHMDIGTAKPTPRERAMVMHHMIDIVDPSDSFSAGRYVGTVTGIIDSLHAWRKIPVIVGGTGLYIKGMTRGIFRGPSADWELREKLLSREAESEGSLYSYLQKLDPSAASKIMPSDTRRIIRALEVCLTAHSKISELQKTRTLSLPFQFIKIGLARERQELYGLIEKRVDSMLARGLLDEVRGLLTMNPGKTALQAIGYKEMVAYLRGECPLDEAVSLIKKRTRNYAKRQLTWFRAEESVQWLDVTGFSTAEEIYRAIAILLKML